MCTPRWTGCWRSNPALGVSLRLKRGSLLAATEADLEKIKASPTAGRLKDPDKIGMPGVVQICKNLKYGERDFRTIKIDDLDVRPIRHYLAGRVQAHQLTRMLATYLTWHLWKAFVPLTFTDEEIPAAVDPVAPATRSRQAITKDAAKETSDGLLPRSKLAPSTCSDHPCRPRLTEPEPEP